jgi:FemAB-related protein (PEP-CTERM system-associated)
MRDLGTPVYPKAFFQNILSTLPDSTAIILVTLDDAPIAAGLLLWYRDTVEIPWASSIREFNAYCPNNKLYWEALQFAIQRGFTRFDFGRSTPNEGTYNFKRQWGAVPLPLHWQYLLKPGASMPELNPHNPRFGSAIRVWRRLPLVVANLLGPVIVRNIP